MRINNMLCLFRWTPQMCVNWEISCNAPCRRIKRNLSRSSWNLGNPPFLPLCESKYSWNVGLSTIFASDCQNTPGNLSIWPFFFQGWSKQGCWRLPEDSDGNCRCTCTLQQGLFLHFDPLGGLCQCWDAFTHEALHPEGNSRKGRKRRICGRVQEKSGWSFSVRGACKYFSLHN